MSRLLASCMDVQDAFPILFLCTVSGARHICSPELIWEEAAFPANRNANYLKGGRIIVLLQETT